MKKEKVRCPRFLKRFIEMLGIHWDVKAFLVEGDTFRINSVVQIKKHEIWIPPRDYHKTGQPDNLFRYVHELVHAHLCETIDPQFAIYLFSKRYTSEPSNLIRNRMEALYWCAAHVDLWVNEKMRQIDPAFADSEQEEFIWAMRGLADEGMKDELAKPISYLCLAMTIAEDLRMGRDGERGLELVHLYEPSFHEVLADLVSAYWDLPALTYDKAKDLLALERSTQTVARILNVGFVPRIEREKGVYVWVVD